MKYMTALVLAPVLLLAAACADDPAGPGMDEVATHTVDADGVWAFVALDGDVATTVTVGDPLTSGGWDLAFNGTSTMLNGGAAGPGGVEGYCLCQNAASSDAQFIAMTPASELADFEAVTAAQIPTDADAWVSDALAPAIDGWYSYDMTTHTIAAAPEQVWKVRTASGDAYASFHVTDLEGATQTNAGQVTIEYALQPSAGAALGAPQTQTIDVGAGAVYLDLETGAEVTDADAWDLHFSGYDIRVNGGVSGTGQAGASLSGETFEAVTDPSDLMANHYRGDAFGGVFAENRWYRYSLEGNHQIWPTYDVYLIRRGDDVYKVQPISYYGDAGETRQITFRYARLQ